MTLAQITPQEWSHFLSTATGVILGSIPGVGIIITFILRLTRKMDIFLVEHEMMFADYAFRAGKKVEDMPTRSGRFRR